METNTRVDSDFFLGTRSELLATKLLRTQDFPAAGKRSALRRCDAGQYESFSIWETDEPGTFAMTCWLRIPRPQQKHQPHTAASFSDLLLRQIDASFETVLSTAQGQFEEKYHHVVTAKFTPETIQVISNIRENLRSVIMNASIVGLQQPRPTMVVVK